MSNQALTVWATDREVVMLVLLRFVCALASALILTAYMPNLGHLLYRLSSYDDCASAYCAEQWLWYDLLGFKIRMVTSVIWMAVWAFLEIRTDRRSGLPVPRLLTHLRYGPVAIMALSIAMILAFDSMLIQYSRWQIVRYVHSDAPVSEWPTLRLHNNDRGFCGNGMAANEYALYGDTAAASFDDPNPATRARALQASMYVYDWINHPNDGPAIVVLNKAVSDPDPMVRDIAARYSAEFHYTPAP
jgi:hypothetical protein